MKQMNQTVLVCKAPWFALRRYILVKLTQILYVFFSFLLLLGVFAAASSWHSLTPIQSHTTIAAPKRADGGAATTYESVKTTKYAALQPPNSKFVPFIVDTYGALGRSAVRCTIHCVYVGYRWGP